MSKAAFRILAGCVGSDKMMNDKSNYSVTYWWQQLFGPVEPEAGRRIGSISFCEFVPLVLLLFIFWLTGNLWSKLWIVTHGGNVACPLTCSSFHFDVLGSQAMMHSPHIGPKRGGHLLFAVVSREIWKTYCLIRLCSGHKLTLMQLGRKGKSQ